MRFLNYIELNNYINLKHAKLDDLRDLNIIIGPNNCGKTSFLRAVNLLSRLAFGDHGQNFGCGTCNASKGKERIIQSVRGSIDVREKYLTRRDVKAVFGYNKSELMKVVPRFSERENGILTMFRNDQNIGNHLTAEFAKEHLGIKEVQGRQIIAEHASPIIWNEVTANLFGHILFCPDERLQAYKGVKIPEHIKSKNFAMDEFNELVQFLKQVVDPKILSIRHSLDLVRVVDSQRFNTSIAEQGSGVKSLICLVADILSATQTKILLVDEPELGLNPSSKHAFLKFLLKQSKDKQIFLATHDPTFVNPILWDRENVSVYLFSIIKDEIVKVDLIQSKQDPNTFAGFLPHTTSLKQVHIYVEGTDDVYIFQIFLNKYARNHFDKWYQIVNKVGIYHLAGDFWQHLLYTIPKGPYTSIVVLDGDKEKNAKEIVNKYEEIEENRFRMIHSLDELRNFVESTSHLLSNDDIPKVPRCLVYCFKRPEIEDYLEPRPASKDEGPAIAYEMKHVPQEIELLFDAIFQMVDRRNE